MGTRNVRGVLTPTASEGLIGAFQNMADTLGVIVTAETVANARVALTNAAAAGATISETNPVYFDIDGVFYKANGDKPGGVWVLRPVNEVQTAQVQGATGATVTLGHGKYSALLTYTLPSKKYRRVVTASASLYGMVTANNANMRVMIGNTHADARFDTGRDDAGNVSTQVMAIVEPGVSPLVQAGIVGDTTGKNATVIVSVNPALNRLILRADPLTMA